MCEIGRNCLRVIVIMLIFLHNHHICNHSSELANEEDDMKIEEQKLPTRNSTPSKGLTQRGNSKYKAKGKKGLKKAHAQSH